MGPVAKGTSMSNASRRSVTVERTTLGQYRIANPRGGSVTLRTDDTDFTAVELLLGAIGGCTLIDVDHLCSRRAEPTTLSVEVTADKTADDSGNHLANVTVTFRAEFPPGEDGDAARRVLPEIVRRSHDRLCTVSRTMERASPVETRIADD